MLVVLLAMTTPFHSEVRLTGSRQAELRGAVVPGPAEIAMACLNQCVSGKSADCVARLSDRSRPKAVVREGSNWLLAALFLRAAMGRLLPVEATRCAGQVGSTLAIGVESGQNAGSAYRLYQAAFDRTTPIVDVSALGHQTP